MNDNIIDISRPLLSVIVPVYNAENYIKKCLDSILNQTYDNVEIIIVDDGSTDKSGSICDEYKHTDPLLRVLHTRNRGSVCARVTGLAEARGEFVAFVDSDDWLDADHYEKYMHIVRDHSDADIDMICGGSIREYGTHSAKNTGMLSIGLYNAQELVAKWKKLIETNEFYCKALLTTVWAHVYRTEIIKKALHGINEKLCNGEDTFIVLSAIGYSRKIYVSDFCDYHYLIRSDSLCRPVERDCFSDIMLLEAELIKRFWGELKHAGIDAFILRHIMYYYLANLSPYELFGQNDNAGCYPNIKKGQNIIIYGKGRLGTFLGKHFNKTKFCNVIGYVDKSDYEKIAAYENYDWIVVAIIDGSAVKSTIELLIDLNVARQKICHIEKEVLTMDNLPLQLKEPLMRLEE